MVNFYQRNSNRIELCLIILALFSVLLYMLGLLDIYKKNQLEETYRYISLIVDCIFLIDFAFKATVFRGKYFNGPWWLVDFVATLPIIVSFGLLNDSLGGVRIARTMRFFLILRVLRVMRLTRVFKFMELDTDEKRSKESTKFKYTIWFSTLFLGIFFIFCIMYVHSSYSTENANIIEFFLVLGFIVSTLISMLIIRAQIPDVSRSEITKLLNIALPKQVADSFLSNPKLMTETIHMPATIVFTDLVGFTKTVEELDGNHEKLREHLTNSFKIITDKHMEHNLIIDKFMGDCVMSFKGGYLVAGTPEEHAASVVKASLDSKLSLKSAGLPYFNDVKIGGASTSSALIGSFGTNKRLTYTVLGDAVNLASRLESAVKQCGVENLFCEKTKQLTEFEKRFVWREVGALKVQGKKTTIQAFEALTKSELKKQWLYYYREALNNFKLKAFKEAREGFKEAIRLRKGGDKLSEVYLGMCESLIISGTQTHWVPTIETRK